MVRNCKGKLKVNYLRSLSLSKPLIPPTLVWASWNLPNQGTKEASNSCKEWSRISPPGKFVKILKNKIYEVQNFTIKPQQLGLFICSTNIMMMPEMTTVKTAGIFSNPLQEGDWTSLSDLIILKRKFSHFLNFSFDYRHWMGINRLVNPAALV